MINFAKKYSLADQEKEVNIIYDPMDLKFCKDISIKFEGHKNNYLSNILENTEIMANAYLNLKNEEKRLKSKIDKYKINNNNLSIKLVIQPKKNI